jgi:hypothetical protein
MLSKAQQRYRMKLYEAGKYIVSVLLWSKRKGAKYLTTLVEGLVFMEWSERDQYFVIHLSEMLYLVVRMGMELPSEILPGGRPRYIRPRVDKFYIYDTYCNMFMQVSHDIWCSMSPHHSYCLRFSLQYGGEKVCKLTLVSQDLTISPLFC